jgi:thymidylate kinase
MSKGLFVTALGLPCTGKTTIMKTLGKLLHWNVFVEPEEEEWTDAVMQRDICGHFTGLMWFRSARVPNIFKARLLADQQEKVILDSYYDKALHYYLGKKGMEWLIHPEDPYFHLASQIAKSDWDMLPDADCIISIDVEYDDWLKLLNIRNRELDNHSEFLKSFHTKEYFIEAAEQLSKEKGIKHIRFKQTLSSPESQALQLKKQLIQEGVIE